jgi:hypothetical protein
LKGVELNMEKLVKGWLLLSLAALVACAVGGPPPGVGVWGAEMTTPLGALTATLTLNEDGSGAVSLDALGGADLDGVTYEGNAIAFVVEIDLQGQTLVLEFSGTVEGDALTGELSSDFGAFALTGTRQ